MNKWTSKQFEEVDWEHLNAAMKNKATMYKIWRSKQTSGFCGMPAQVWIYSGDKYPDKGCPNCGTRETDAHLMLCLEKDRTCLLIDNADKLAKWLETDRKSDPELICWIPKHILMRNDNSFSALGWMSPKMRALAESQDKIGWMNFIEGHISILFFTIQKNHLAMSSSYLNGADWTKQ
jgi:hypothetical protein